MRITHVEPYRMLPSPRPALTSPARTPNLTKGSQGNQVPMRLDLAAYARQAFMRSAAERSKRVEELRERVESGHYHVDVQALTETIVTVTLRGENKTMASPSSLSSTDAQIATAVHAMRAEAQEYEKLTLTLRAIRGMLAAQDYEGALSACDGLALAARDLEQRCLERLSLCGFKLDQVAAEEEKEDLHPELASAFSDLCRAQVQARTELMVSMEILEDLRAHTASLRAALEGRRVGTYNAQGRIQE